MGIGPFWQGSNARVMKAVVTLGLGVSLSLFVQGQVDLHPVISPTRMNVVYRGIPNPMAVAVPGHTWNDIRLEVDDVHRLECDDSGTCLLTPCNDVKVRSLKSAPPSPTTRAKPRRSLPFHSAFDAFQTRS